MDKFIYGKDPTLGVVSVNSTGDGNITVFCSDGTARVMDSPYWILYHRPIEYSIELKGNLHYKYAVEYPTYKSFNWAKTQCRQKGIDHFVVYNPEEAFMVRSGVTYYKGMKPKDLKVLSFDIETTGLTHNNDSKVLLISNKFRGPDREETVLFKYNEHDTQEEMISIWCDYVRLIDPDVIVGHNLFGFDLPYLRFCGGDLNLGRNGGPAKFARNPSKFRKDGSQSYDFHNINIYGREIIDTFHLSIKYDIKRKYPSYGLKPIIKAEGLEKPGRQYYDAATIKDNYQNPKEWQKIVEYAKDDADDALKLFDLMIPSFFYYAQSIPKTMQQIINSATGSQINSFMVRSYLSQGHSIPKASDADGFQGAISYGNPGIYNNVYKIDVASLYPSIMLQYGVQSLAKDPKGCMLRMVDTFTRERLKNKALAKQTGDRHYKDLESAQKIVINSAYGFMGAPGLNFNYPQGAAEVTRRGREVLTNAIGWAENNGYTIVNVDTDSISYTGSWDIKADLEQINASCLEMIRWEDDGIYRRVIVVKAKNYVLQDMKGKVTIKGSGLKATMKEPALREFIERLIKELLDGNSGNINGLYRDYVRRIMSITSGTIPQWCSKKTITKAILTPTRTNESRVKEAIQRAGKKVSEGDKIFVYFKTPTELALPSTFDGVYSHKKLLEKLFKTVKIFESILDITQFPNYALKRNQERLQEIIDVPRRQENMEIGC